MIFDDVAAFTRSGLIVLGYDEDDLPVLDPGPATELILQKLTPSWMAFLTVGGGAASSVEGAFDRPFLSVRAIGKQGDYKGSEKFAQDLDAIFLSASGNTLVGEAPTLGISRTGGPPALLQRDSGDRYHWICSYIVETQTGR